MITIEDDRKTRLRGLTHEEARAFMVFLVTEEIRHEEDIKMIRERLRLLRNIHGIEGNELARVYTIAGRTKSKNE